MGAASLMFSDFPTHRFPLPSLDNNLFIHPIEIASNPNSLSATEMTLAAPLLLRHDL
jgi:hypothetical protein